MLMTQSGGDSGAGGMHGFSHAYVHRLGKYRVLAQIGRGGMAEVFLAVMEGPERFSKLIALKVLRAEYCEDSQGRAAFMNEARLAARLNHPNVVSTYEVGEDSGRLFIAMEYLDGQPLSRVLSRMRTESDCRIPQVVLLKVISETLSGLHHAHELKDFDGSPLNLVHRDVSPHNIFVTYDGVVKVLDFGIAKVVSSAHETRTGVMKGKIAYMAPEQVSCENKAIDRRVDIHATGCCLWEIIAGRRPYKEFSDVAILAKIGTEGLPPLRPAAPDVAEELERVCMKAVAFQPEDRYADASEFQTDLDRHIASLGISVGPREIGKWIASSFADMRLETQHLIEAQLSRAKLTSTQELPPLSLSAPASLADSDSANGFRSLTRDPSLSSSHARTDASEETLQSGDDARAHRPRSAARLRPIWWGVGSALAISVVFFAFSAARSRQATSAGDLPVTSVAPPATVTLKIAAQPANARILFDGQPMPTNPAEIRRQKDGASHVVRVEAAGHVGATETVTLDIDRALTFILVKDFGAPQTPSAETPTPKVPIANPRVPAGRPAKSKPDTTTEPVAPSPPSTAPAPPSKRKQIDEDNPFEKR